MKKEVSINLSQDLPIRKLREFVIEANHFGSYILIQSQRLQINAKSLLSVMMIGEFERENIILTAEGADSEKALEHLTPLLTS
jgi:phosphotransferase system HPr (HPr) family protein